MRGTLAMTGLDHVLIDGMNQAELALTAAFREAAEELLELLRDLTFGAGLGGRLPYTWKYKVYPGSGSSLEPTAFFYSAAGAILSFFSPPQRVITPIGGGFAIPVNPVIGRRGKPLKPWEVEDRFNQDLQARRLPSGNIGLYLDLVKGKSQRRPGFRKATKGRLAQGRKAEMTLMFVLVRSLRSKPVLKLQAAAQQIAARIPSLYDKHMGAQR